MGCDFYVVTDLIVEYIFKNKLQTETINYKRAPHYFWDHGSDDNWDSDKEMQQFNKKEVIFDGGEWLIKNKDNINDYKCIINEYLFGMSSTKKELTKLKHKICIEKQNSLKNRMKPGLFENYIKQYFDEVLKDEKDLDTDIMKSFRDSVNFRYGWELNSFIDNVVHRQTDEINDSIICIKKITKCLYSTRR
ncbi:MAG: hypothetical protein Satyrvirus2_72 [Satyrvirus sp.]|uniref:Uncharacterized protein n=1 Tax=Satyrvirus sp. TaxID=2487771 RepID=A0A3G5AFL2_9VIRU|nr:MAG: hypothetical protein Satyrvirus2_72 [Satyrvirus sp.]